MTDLFFDLDGTLTDPREGIVRSIEYALINLGRTAPEHAALEAFIGPPLADTFAQLLATEDESIIAGAIGPDVAVIGDRIDDILAAHANDAVAIAVAWGYGTAEELAAGSADHLVTTVEELVRYVLDGATPQGHNGSRTS